ncbi:MotA/TolQ/ExbB proton channel family protein [Methanosphaera sp. BMS]|uniref:MotA/TolQ/ExbB proton channel family protein n=1 Tax=Methanosphaera sp. BMS TaxID=1789762 RepID=UPI000DC1E998|nr:MotA/TolQ/ExbB proton channel family protein [Methanosphaera sp. BMS]AWX32470.1 flagellar motor protein MotA [Methanosphaera sp. BMS]
MNTTIPYTNLITGTMDVISQSLTIPVLIILSIMFIITVVMLGMVISEYTSRKKVSVETISNLIYDINNATSINELDAIVSNCQLPQSQKDVLNRIIESDSLTETSREALAGRLVETEEEKTENTLQKTDIITKIGPTLGLMGTLIPMGPGLAALGAGDITTLAQSLTVAFDTTIVGIGSGALAYVLSKVRRGWYEHYLSDLDALTDALLDKMGRL